MKVLQLVDAGVVLVDLDLVEVTARVFERSPLRCFLRSHEDRPAPGVFRAARNFDARDPLWDDAGVGCGVAPALDAEGLAIRAIDDHVSAPSPFRLIRLDQRLDNDHRCVRSCAVLKGGIDRGELGKRGHEAIPSNMSSCPCSRCSSAGTAFHACI